MFQVVTYNCFSPFKVLDASGRMNPGHSKTGSKQDTAPADVDMEEAPSMSDGDVCISATSQSPRLASGAVSGGFLALALFLFFFFVLFLRHI